MSELYMVTGAGGHLGNSIVRTLLARGSRVNALVMNERDGAALNGLDCQVFYGNVLDKDTLSRFFSPGIVIHCAGIISIASAYSQAVYDVNVTGTQNVIDCCIKAGVSKLVYVSSVHAIPEQPAGTVITETHSFSPDVVSGLYAKTKAEATRRVLSAADKLKVAVVHPSGIIGPGDYGKGHVNQMIIDYVSGSLSACVRGGYDFVDVRDVADGVIAAADAVSAPSGECYILSNKRFEVSELLARLSDITGKKPIRTVLPLWFARASAPLAELYYKIRREPPLFTRYSLYTLNSNSLFSHAKASRELAYCPRPIDATLRDTVMWMLLAGRISPLPHASAL